MRLLTGIGVPVKHPELFVEEVLRLVCHAQFCRRKRTVGEFLGLVEEAFRGHGVQNIDRAPRFLQILIFSGQSVCQDRGPGIQTTHGIVRASTFRS